MALCEQCLDKDAEPDSLVRIGKFVCFECRTGRTTQKEESEEEEENEDSDEENSDDEKSDEDSDEEEPEYAFSCPKCGHQKIEVNVTFRVRGYLEGSRTIEFDDDGDEYDTDDDYDTSNFELDEIDDHNETGDATCVKCGRTYDEKEWRESTKKVKE